MKKIIYLLSLTLLVLLVGCSFNNETTVKTSKTLKNSTVVTTTKKPTTTTEKKELIETSVDTLSLGAIRQKDFTFVSNTSDEVSLRINDESIASYTLDDDTITIKTYKEGSTSLDFIVNEEVVKTVEIIVERQFITFPLAYGTIVLKGKNKTATVKAILLEEIDGITPVWSLSDESIVSIETQGVIAKFTSLKKGICIVTMTYGEYSESFEIRVTNIRGDI